MSDKLYNILKWVAILFLPALATLVSVVFNIWGIPYAEQISTTITAVATFIGVIIGVSAIKYNSKGGSDNE